MEIKNISLAERCEICHQTDHFNASQNHCARCAETKQRMAQIMAAPLTVVTERTISEILFGAVKLGTVSGGLIAMTTGLLWLLPEGTDELLLLTALAGLGGPLIGLVFGFFFGLIVRLATWLEEQDLRTRLG